MLNSGHLPIADTLSRFCRCPLFKCFTVSHPYFQTVIYVHVFQSSNFYKETFLILFHINILGRLPFLLFYQTLRNTEYSNQFSFKLFYVENIDLILHASILDITQFENKGAVYIFFKSPCFSLNDVKIDCSIGMSKAH